MTNKKRTFLSPPHMGGKEMEYVKDAFDSNYIAPVGSYINKFEYSIKEYTGAKYALAVSSGTAAMHLALRILGIGEGDEVYASSFNFIGSVSPVKYEKGELVFIDSDRDSWNMDPILLEKDIAHRKKYNQTLPAALILTHLYGQPARIDLISEICSHYGINLIEDAAESLGGFHKKRHTGTFGKFGILSFNGNKILTTSGGGAIISNEKELIEKAKYYATQAKEDKPYYEHTDFGYNYRISNILAAIGTAQMEVIEERVSKKRWIFDTYAKQLDGYCSFMPEIYGARGNRWLTTALFNCDPEKIRLALEAENIESRPLWKPMHMQPVFINSKNIGGSVSCDLFYKGLCLPSGTTMTFEDIKNVCDIIKEAASK